MPVAQSEFDDFCRFAFAFLDDRGTRYLVVGGLAVMVVGEPRTTAGADAAANLRTRRRHGPLESPAAGARHCEKLAGFRTGLR